MNTLSKSEKMNNYNEYDSKKTIYNKLDFQSKEQYKMIRANLDFTITEDVKCPVIGVTSSMRGEGKSTTAINVACALAENGSRVVLIDGDLRIPTVSRKIIVNENHGLTDLLNGKGAQLSDYQSPEYNNLYVLPVGHIPPNPSELLGSSRMESVLSAMKEKFDYIIIDLPPVNIVSDAVSISKYLYGMIVVVREDFTEKKELEHCIRQLNLSNVRILGCVMNCVKFRERSYKKNKKYSYNSYFR